MTTSLAGIEEEKEVDVGLYEEAEDESEDILDEGRVSVPTTAGGGSSKHVRKEGKREPSLLLISVDEAGVGGC